MDEIAALEAMVDRWEADLPLLTGFPRESLSMAIGDLRMHIEESKEGEDD